MKEFVMPRFGGKDMLLVVACGLGHGYNGVTFVYKRNSYDRRHDDHGQ